MRRDLVLGMMAVGARQDIQTAGVFPDAIGGLVEYSRLAVGAEDFHVEDVGYCPRQARAEQYDAEVEALLRRSGSFLAGRQIFPWDIAGVI